MAGAERVAAGVRRPHASRSTPTPPSATSSSAPSTRTGSSSGRSEAEIRGLYVIVDPQQTRGRDPVDVARLALAGGARIIQWRDKTRDKGEQLPQAQAIRDLCRERGALFFVNDHVDLALALSADGAHLGQRDLPPSLVRPWLPAGFLLGVSSNTVDEARRAEREGADYVGVGAIFPTAEQERHASGEPGATARGEGGREACPSSR